MAYSEGVKLIAQNGQQIDPASELTQKDIQNLNDSLSEMVSQLKFLSSVRGIAADLRVTLLSGTVTTVTTVSTVTTIGTVNNIATIGTVAANQAVPALQNTLVQLGNVANTIGY